MQNNFPSPSEVRAALDKPDPEYAVDGAVDKLLPIVTAEGGWPIEPAAPKFADRWAVQYQHFYTFNGEGRWMALMAPNFDTEAEARDYLARHQELPRARVVFIPGEQS